LRENRRDNAALPHSAKAQSASVGRSIVDSPSTDIHPDANTSACDAHASSRRLFGAVTLDG
jgi:hypothetical protein